MQTRHGKIPQASARKVVDFHPQALGPFDGEDGRLDSRRVVDAVAVGSENLRHYPGLVQEPDVFEIGHRHQRLARRQPGGVPGADLLHAFGKVAVDKLGGKEGVAQEDPGAEADGIEGTPFHRGGKDQVQRAFICALHLQGSGPQGQCRAQTQRILGSRAHG